MQVRSLLKLASAVVLLALASGTMHAQGMGHPLTAPPPPGAKSAKCVNRPIPQLEDITAKSGVTFQHASSPDKKYIFESMSGGVLLVVHVRKPLEEHQRENELLVVSGIDQSA